MKENLEYDKIEEEDNIYYSEEDFAEIDDSPANYAQPEDSIEDNEDLKPKFDTLSLLLIVLKVLIQPVEGWKSLRRLSIKPEELLSTLYYPLLAVLAVSKFATLIYFPSTSISNLVVGSVIAFVSFFFGYFLVITLIKILLQKVYTDNFQEAFGKNFIIISLSSLCIFSIFIELFPMLWPILIFLPLWTIYTICKGIRFFKLPPKGIIRFTAILCLAIIGVPSVLDWFLNMMIPY